jgi:hypothetical protein
MVISRVGAGTVQPRSSSSARRGPRRGQSLYWLVVLVGGLVLNQHLVAGSI